jgi:lipopolysaccharide transport system permease protein
MPGIGFRNPEVSLEGNAREGNTMVIRCGIENQSGARWSAEEGFGAGYHLFDDPTGTLVVDGERTPLELAPQAAQDIRIRLGTPREPGDYTIYVSAMQEHVAWFYEQGWPFLLIQLVVGENGDAHLRGWRITDMRSVRLRRFIRSLGRAFTLPFQSIWRNRSLIRTLVRRDVLSRYTGSFAGAFWAILNPLLLMLTYFFVFGIVMETKFGNDPSRTGFALYFLAGMLPWLAFSEAAGRAPFVLLEHRNFIKKLVFPVETLPVNVVVSGLVTEFFGLILFALALLLIRGSIPVSVLWLPLVIIPQVLFTTGMSWFLSALGVFARDLGQIIGYLLTVLMFLTPIFYPEQQLPKAVAGFIRKNPIYVLVHAYRSILLEGTAPDWVSLGWFTLAAALIFLLGHAWFYKLRKSFADLI